MIGCARTAPIPRGDLGGGDGRRHWASRRCSSAARRPPMGGVGRRNAAGPGRPPDKPSARNRSHDPRQARNRAAAFRALVGDPPRHFSRADERHEGGAAFSYAWLKQIAPVARARSPSVSRNPFGGDEEPRVTPLRSVRGVDHDQWCVGHRIYSRGTNSALSQHASALTGSHNPAGVVWSFAV